ncbi:uracil-DNA glycosylase [Proboscivirus elephantidbeta5]|uniref:Uracil-DNA glycosylase n=1 Tax=Elephant endotheliotropic herpesvirus 5 TaxID=768738 RepID=A0A075CXP7_9BETA|nr:uracil-DNA glycosylase [Elephant endotheliotropic herpesvirus 5]AHC02766.1 uracil-DNA glycosylase [Elephant endotheliotropic herpesvirus 5]
MALREWVMQFYDNEEEATTNAAKKSPALALTSKPNTTNDTNSEDSNDNRDPKRFHQPGTSKRKHENDTIEETVKKYKNTSVEMQKPSKKDLFERMNLNQAWVDFIDLTDFDMETLIRVQSFVEEQRSLEIIYPAPKNVHRWSYLCLPDQVKVVIVGQDPYPQPHRADGLAFSTGDGCVAPSLRNIYKELQRSVEGFVIPPHGHLESWATQGVLLLNTAFTVVRGVPGAHSTIGWKTLSDRVIMQLSAKKSNLVFMLWGNHAKEKMGLIDKSKHCILTSAHPSPLAATRYAGFVGNNHFIKANRYIEDHGQEPINWNSLINHTS